MKATTINTVARGINARRNSFSVIVSDFRTSWYKVYNTAAKADYAQTQEMLKALREQKKGTDDELAAKIDENMKVYKQKAYEMECVFAKAKSLVLSEEEKACIKSMYEDGFAWDNFTMEFICKGLTGTMYINNGLPMESKKNKETGEKEWKEVEKWTVMKVARYFRMAQNGFVTMKRLEK